MFIKILGAIDIIIGLLLILLGIGMNTPKIILMVSGIVLVVKSLLGFFKDFASWIDLLSGVIIIIAVYVTIPSVILIILAILLIQKGLFSYI
jgi:hypothetical protein